MPKDLRNGQNDHIALMSTFLSELKEVKGSDFPAWLRSLTDIVDKNWFYGRLDDSKVLEIGAILKEERQPGSFVVYFSRGVLGSLSVLYLDGERETHLKRCSNKEELYELLKQLNIGLENGVDRHSTLYSYD